MAKVDVAIKVLSRLNPYDLKLVSALLPKSVQLNSAIPKKLRRVIYRTRNLKRGALSILAWHFDDSDVEGHAEISEALSRYHDSLRVPPLSTLDVPSTKELKAPVKPSVNLKIKVKPKPKVKLPDPVVEPEEPIVETKPDPIKFVVPERTRGLESYRVNEPRCYDMADPKMLVDTKEFDYTQSYDSPHEDGFDTDLIMYSPVKRIQIGQYVNGQNAVVERQVGDQQQVWAVDSGGVINCGWINQVLVEESVATKDRVTIQTVQGPFYGWVITEVEPVSIDKS